MTLDVFGRKRPPTPLADPESRGELIGYQRGIIAIPSLPGIEKGWRGAVVQASLPCLSVRSAVASSLQAGSSPFRLALGWISTSALVITFTGGKRGERARDMVPCPRRPRWFLI